MAEQVAVDIVIGTKEWFTTIAEIDREEGVIDVGEVQIPNEEREAGGDEVEDEHSCGASPEA